MSVFVRGLTRVSGFHRSTGLLFLRSQSGGNAGGIPGLGNQGKAQIMTLGDAMSTRSSDDKVETMYLYLFLHILHNTGLTITQGALVCTKQQFQGICCFKEIGGYISKIVEKSLTHILAIVCIFLNRITFLFFNAPVLILNSLGVLFYRPWPGLGVLRDICGDDPTCSSKMQPPRFCFCKAICAGLSMLQIHFCISIRANLVQ